MPRERKGSVKNKNSNCGNEGNDSEITAKTTKKRRTSNANNNSNNNQNNSNNNNLNNNNPNNLNNKALELIPPQPIGIYGDTIIASNPFDDTPQQSSQAVSQQSTAQSQQTPQGTNQSPNNSMMSNAPNGSMGPMGPQSQSLQSQTGAQAPKPVPLMSGKIYPPEQSMVFNPANPNAPPIYPCGICHKEVHDNDQAILCESGCNFWFHRICTGISERAYFLLTQEVYAEWVCDKCASNKTIPLVKFKP